MSKFISLYVCESANTRQTIQNVISFKLNGVYRHKMALIWLYSGPRNCAAVEEWQSPKYAGKQAIGYRLSEPELNFWEV